MQIARKRLNFQFNQHDNISPICNEVVGMYQSKNSFRATKIKKKIHTLKEILVSTKVAIPARATSRTDVDSDADPSIYCSNEKKINLSCFFFFFLNSSSYSIIRSLNNPEESRQQIILFMLEPSRDQNQYVITIYHAKILHNR